MQELQVLELNAFLAFENGLEQAVASSWSGNLMLLNCSARATPSSGNLAGTDTQTSQVQSHSVKLTSQLRMQSRCLQHHLMSL